MMVSLSREEKLLRSVTTSIPKKKLMTNSLLLRSLSVAQPTLPRALLVPVESLLKLRDRKSRTNLLILQSK